VVLVDGDAYVIDCGNGVAHQLHQAGVAPSALRGVFITHHHSDHNADLGTLFLLSWPYLRRPVPVVAPPPLVSMVRHFLEMSRYDLEIRMADEGRPPLADFLLPREIDRGGVVYQDDKVEVRAALVDHPPVEPAFAYRIETADRSIVISGDTRPCDALVDLARGADVLVHEVIYPPAMEKLVEGNNGRTVLAHLLASHTSVDDVGAIAERAGVGTLVLSHLSPPNPAVMPDLQWLEAARRGYSGTVLVGQDLLVV
jgi:ribonuclease BN (tRNA processing enzyme)